MEAVVDDSGGLPEGGPTPGEGGTRDQPRAVNDNGMTEDCQKTVDDADKIADKIADDNSDDIVGKNNHLCVEMMSENSAKNNTVKCVRDMDSSDCGAALNGKRKRNRRKQKGGGRHHRKWKPYDKLTWDERKTLEERETKRACKKRETRFASGQAMAPYNTTQFLMEQHEPSESEFHLEDHVHRHHEHRRDSRISQERSFGNRPNDSDALSGNLSFSGGSGDGSSDGSYDSNDEEIFLEKDFTEAYEQYQSEKLESMTKQELVREHLQLEEEVESLKKQLKESENRRRSSGSSSHGIPADFKTDDVSTIQVLELLKQVKKLKEDNLTLKMENERLDSKSNPDGAPKTMDVAT